MIPAQDDVAAEAMDWPRTDSAEIIPSRLCPITWGGSDEALRALAWSNAARTVLTLGAYHFTAKVAWRRQLWSAVRIQGEPLRYTGTVRDILLPFLGFLAIVAATVIGVLVAKRYGVAKLPVPNRAARFGVSIPLVFLLGLSAWGARSYLLSRTSIRGQAGRLVGSPLSYALVHFFTAFATPLTLGLILPWRQAWLQRRLIGGMVIGAHRFAFDGARPKLLLRRFLGVWAAGIAVYLAAVLTIAVSPVGQKIAFAQVAGQWPVPDRNEVAFLIGIGIAAGLVLTAIAAWYRVGVLRHFAAVTRIDGVALRFEADTRNFVTLAVTNWLIRIGSLFLLSSIAELRMTRFLVQSLRRDTGH